MTEWRDLPPPPDPTQPGWDHEQYPEPPPGPDPVGVAAIVLGCIGVVAFGILLAPVTALLGAVAGRRARERGRSLETAYWALGLAVLDGVVWLLLHFAFDLVFLAG